jgi:hypothetical protein
MLASAAVLGGAAAPAPGAPAAGREAGAPEGAAPRASDYARQLVFVALVGEPWGYMGSRAFLWELERGGATVQGLDLSLVDQVGASGT